MKHFIILFYAYVIGLFRAVLMSHDKLIQFVFIPGINKLRLFNANVRAYYEFHKAKNTVPAYKKFLQSKSFNYPNFKGLVPQIGGIPVIDKENYIKKYSLEDRCVKGKIPKTGLVIDESSGSSGMPTNWIRGEKERTTNAKFIKFG
mgnify:FL=1